MYVMKASTSKNKLNLRFNVLMENSLLRKYRVLKSKFFDIHFLGLTKFMTTFLLIFK